MLAEAREQAKRGIATIFSYRVKDPKRFGVAQVDTSGEVVNLEEKPKNPKSHFAVTGLYFYNNEAINIAKSLKPSLRGELEITDVNIAYLKAKRLKSQILGRGFAWLDTGTHDSLLEAGEFVRTIELRQGYKIACLEEIAYHNGWINENELLKRAEILDKSGYGAYLRNLLEGM